MHREVWKHSDYYCSRNWQKGEFLFSFRPHLVALIVESERDRLVAVWVEDIDAPNDELTTIQVEIID